MPRISIETRRRVIVLSRLKYSVQDIQRRFAEERIFVSKVALYKLLLKYKRYGVIEKTPKPGSLHILNEEQVDERMAENNELTARKYQLILSNEYGKD